MKRVENVADVLEVQFKVTEIFNFAIDIFHIVSCIFLFLLCCNASAFVICAIRITYLLT